MTKFWRNWKAFPHLVQIGPVVYDIKVDHTPRAEIKPFKFGCCNNADGVITIYADTISCPAVARRVLMHEIGHAMCFVNCCYAAKNEEALVSTIEIFFGQFFIENPELVKWLSKDNG